jgi:hypothetical protein
MTGLRLSDGPEQSRMPFFHDNKPLGDPDAQAVLYRHGHARRGFPRPDHQNAAECIEAIPDPGNLQTFTLDFYCTIHCGIRINGSQRGAENIDKLFPLSHVHDYPNSGGVQ